MRRPARRTGSSSATRTRWRRPCGTSTTWAGGAPEVEAIARSRTYDLTFLTAADFPWVQDGTRDSDAARQRMQRRFEAELEARPEPVDRAPRGRSRGGWRRRPRPSRTTWGFREEEERARSVR